MFYPLCLILMTALCWQHVSSRHLAPSNYHSLQHPYYPPYSDYGYSYSGPLPYQPQQPFHQSYQQPYHSPLYSPPGTYFDQRRGILRPFPGGGVPVFVDFHKLCPNQYVGLKAHPEHHQYYYVCKPDCVIFGKCQNLQIFNSTSGQCVQHPPPEYKPTCTEVGRFPLFSDCHLYYKCEEDLQPKIYSCPPFMVFSPASKKCIMGNKCSPTQISSHSSYIPEYCANKFPPCYENGVFRSPSDCSLYYRCQLQSNGVYLQTRFRCPTGQFYDLQKNECLPLEKVPCDCIQVAELVYPKPNTISYQPAVYPSQYDFNSLEENLYPIEPSQEETIKNCNNNESTSESENEEVVGTTVVPQPVATTLIPEVDEQDDSDAGVLSDYIDLGAGNPNSEIDELEGVVNDPITTTISSEETSSYEGSGTDSDSVETTLSPNCTNTQTTEEDTKTTKVVEDLENAATTTDACEEITDRPEAPVEEPKNHTTTTPPMEDLKTSTDNEIITTTVKEIGTTTISASSPQPTPCDNMVEINEINDKPMSTDTHAQKKTCQAQLITTSSNSEPTTTTIDSKFTRDSRSTILEQNSTTITKVTSTVTTQLPIIETTANSNNWEAIQVPDETNLIPEINGLEEEHDITHVPLADSSENEISSDWLHTTTTKQSTTEITIPLQTPKFEQETTTESKTAIKTTEESNTKLLVESAPDMVTTTTTERPLKPTVDETTDIPDEIAVTIDDFESSTQTAEGNSEHENLLPINLKDKSVTLRAADFTEEQFIPVHGHSTAKDNLPDHTTDFNYITDDFTEDTTNFDDDYTTVMADKETSTPAVIQEQEIPETLSSVEMNEMNDNGKTTTTLKRRQTSPIETTQVTTITPPIQMTMTPEPSAQTTESPKTMMPTMLVDENPTDFDSYDDLLGVMDSEIILHNGRIEEVSNNEITSAETTQTFTKAKQQFPFTPSTMLTRTLTPTTTPKYKTNTLETTSNPCAKHSNSLVVHVRKEAENDHILPSSLDSPPSKIADSPCIEIDNNGRIPRLEIIAERPIDVHFSVYPSTCEKDNERNYSPTGNRAVFLRWFANKSKQTMGFETGNDGKTKDD